MGGQVVGAEQVGVRRVAEASRIVGEDVLACGQVHDERRRLMRWAVSRAERTEGSCSPMLAGGVPMEIVQMILGHASPEVT